MSAAPYSPASPRPAASRILEHCSSLERVLAEDEASAWARLEREIGCDLARQLVVALSGRYGPARSCFAV